MKAFIFSAALAMSALFVTPASAAKFSVTGGGTSIIDANGTADYTSLAEAAADFTSFPGGSTSPWTLLIRSDLQESSSALFGNRTNGHSVTVRPAPGTSVTVTFNMNSRPPGATQIIWDGNIVIGPNKQTATTQDPSQPDFVDYMDTDNFVIDGCNTPGGTARNLTLLTPESATTTTLIPRFMVRVVGQADNSVVRNTTILCNVAGNEYFGVYYNARYVTQGALFYLPQNGTVSNCFISVAKGNNGRGVMATIAGSVPQEAVGFDAIRGLNVSNNDIVASHRAIQYGFNAGGKMIGNRIRIVQESSSGNRPEVLIHTGSNGVTSPFTTDIIGNHVYEVHSASSTGFNYVIGVGGSATANPSAVYNIVNNMMGGFRADATITNSASWLLRAISIENGTNASTFNIRHNSINMNDIPSFGPNGEVDDRNRLAALSLLNAGGFTGMINFENNIVRSAQHNGRVISGVTTPTAAQLIPTSTLNFNNNTYFNTNGAQFAHLNGADYPTLASWKSGTGLDTASNLIDPFAPGSGGKWKSNSDLHFDADPIAGFDGVAIATVTNDIDGDPRPTPPTKGADEYNPNSSVDGWSLY